MAIHFTVDLVIFVVAFVIGTDYVIPDDDLHMRLESYLPGILLGSFVFPCLVYICGLYAPQSYKQRVTTRAIVLAICLVGTVLLMVPLFYLKKSTIIGRGVFGISVAIVYFTIIIHHGILLRCLRNYRERVAFIMTCTFDELEARFFQSLGTENMELVGLIHYDNYQPIGEMRVLGKVSELADIVPREDIQRVLGTSKRIGDPAMCKAFCELRYSGVQVMSLVSVFEEVHQLVPLELITPEWLLAASTQPHMLYIKKVKRAFDTIVSLLGLVFLGPVMLAGMLAVKLSSPGPIFTGRCGPGALAVRSTSPNCAPCARTRRSTGPSGPPPARIRVRLPWAISSGNTGLMKFPSSSTCSRATCPSSDRDRSGRCSSRSWRSKSPTFRSA